MELEKQNRSSSTYSINTRRHSNVAFFKMFNNTNNHNPQEQVLEDAVNDVGSNNTNNANPQELTSLVYAIFKHI